MRIERWRGGCVEGPTLSVQGPLGPINRGMIRWDVQSPLFQLDGSAELSHGSCPSPALGLDVLRLAYWGRLWKASVKTSQLILTGQEDWQSPPPSPPTSTLHLASELFTVMGT